MTITRRELLRAAGASWALGALGCVGSLAPDDGPKDLIARQDNPYNAEPRLDHLTESWITPYRHFYVRSHGNQPAIAPASWELLVEGHVERPQRLRLEDLERMAKTTVAATMQCAGNRRNEHSLVKPVGGVQWDAGAIGTAEWRGVRLADVLERAGLKSGAKHLWFEGRDSVTLKDRQTLFGGGVPVAKAMQPGTLVALEMNGRPLAREHGYPARTVVPGYIGARSVKWLGRIIVADRPSENNFVARDYKLFPPSETAETVKPENYEPIYEPVLSSAICSPMAGRTVPAGKVRVSGYAVPPGTDGATVAGVQVSPDGGGTWVSATLSGKDAPYAWKLWSVDLNLQPGAQTLVVRATDSQGKLQPEKAPWNFKGYLYNGWHRVPVTVG
jgi:sulfite oxidase